MKKIYLTILIALTLRVLWLPDNLFFGYEQGRDFLKLTEIASGDPALIGPKTDIDGLFHGAFSYYSLLSSFVLFGGNPFLVLLSLIVIHTISIVFLYKFALSLKEKKFAYLVVFLYAISYSSVVYSRWLSNPNLVPALAIFFLYFLKRAEKKKSMLVVAAVLWALIFHLQVVAALILILPASYFVVSNKLLTVKNTTLSVLAVVAVLSTYLIFNFKNDNILLNGLIGYISEGGQSSPLMVRLDEFNNQIVDDFFPPDRAVAFMLFWLVILVNFLSVKRDFGSRYILLLFFSAPIVFILLGVTPLRHLFILSPLFTSLLVANALHFLYQKKFLIPAILLFLVIIVGSISTIFMRLPVSNQNFIYHAQSTYLADMKNLLDHAYNDANGALFSYDYYSVPYWHKEAWEYMFLWYGKWKYGYLPEKNRTRVFYVFIEPDETQPKYQEDWYKTLAGTSILLGEYTSGKLRVEKREEF